jgi:hypothetical protein
MAPSVASVVADSQRVVISVRRDGTTDMVVQIGVPNTSADYGVLIPTPSEPTIDPTPISEQVLDGLDVETRPKIYKIDLNAEHSASCTCGAIAGSDTTPANGDAVKASQPTNVGPVTATVVTATDNTALNQWLDGNGFVIPDERQALIGNYVGPGRYFIAVKRNDAVVTNGPTSIGLHYKLVGDHRLLSLAFARLGAAPTVGFTVFLFAKDLTSPTDPFQPLTLDDLDSGRLLANDYQGAVQSAVQARGGTAFVLESGGRSRDGTSRNALTTYYDALPTDQDALLLRMTTVLTADELTQDVTFLTPLTEPFSNSRDIVMGQSTPKAAGFGVLGLVAFGWRARRRARRRA